MAGLLNIDFQDPDTASWMGLANGLLSAGAPSRQRIGTGQALMMGLQGMQQGQMGAREYAQQQELMRRKMAGQDLDMQMGQMRLGGMQQEIKDREAAKLYQAKLPEIIASFGNDYQGMVKAGLPYEMVKQIAESRNLGRDKVTRTEKVEGANGEQLIRGFNELGDVVGQDQAGYVAPVQVDRGDQISMVKPTAGMNFKVGMSPQDRDASSRGWAGINLQREQASRPTWNNEVGAFILPPSQQNPQGAKIDLAGFTKPEKPLTEVQAKAVTFASRMNNANTIINELSSKGVDKSSAGKQFMEAIPGIGGGLGNLYNATLPENVQKLDQAKRDWVNANLRNESGAAIGRDEFTNADKQYFPQIGDKPEVIQQKAINRKLAEEGMRSQAGSGAKNIDSIVSGTKPVTGTQKTKIISLDGGGSATAKLGADGNYYVERNGKKYRVEE
jgi:hypothetical protein